MVKPVMRAEPWLHVHASSREPAQQSSPPLPSGDVHQRSEHSTEDEGGEVDGDGKWAGDGAGDGDGDGESDGDGENDGNCDGDGDGDCDHVHGPPGTRVA